MTGTCCYLNRISSEQDRTENPGGVYDVGYKSCLSFRSKFSHLGKSRVPAGQSELSPVQGASLLVGPVCMYYARLPRLVGHFMCVCARAHARSRAYTHTHTHTHTHTLFTTQQRSQPMPQTTRTPSISLSCVSVLRSAPLASLALQQELHESPLPQCSPRKCLLQPLKGFPILSPHEGLLHLPHTASLCPYTHRHPLPRCLLRVHLCHPLWRVLLRHHVSDTRVYGVLVIPRH